MSQFEEQIKVASLALIPECYTHILLGDDLVNVRKHNFNKGDSGMDRKQEVGDRSDLAHSVN